MKKEHIGSDFDDFLREEHLLEISADTAAKRVIARGDEAAVRLPSEEEAELLDALDECRSRRGRFSR